jgi:multidrug efflux pump subunit AcrB
LAIPFRSYIQPIIIMTAIPMGLIGTVIGHFLMGYEMSIMSALGFTALTGVVINDSLILIVKVNELARNGSSHFEAALEGSILRFRPIFLTTLTTTAGLLPMLLETSTQARFLIPMAVSLAFGLVFATGIILLLVPSTYLIVEDIRALLSGPKEPNRPRPEGPAPATS